MSKRMRGNLFWYLFLLIKIYNGFSTKTRQNEDFCCLTSNSREPSVLKIETLSRTHAVCIHTLWLWLKLIVSLSHSHVLGVPFNQRFELILPIAFCKYASLFFRASSENDVKNKNPRSFSFLKFIEVIGFWLCFRLLSLSCSLFLCTSSNFIYSRFA